MVRKLVTLVVYIHLDRTGENFTKPNKKFNFNYACKYMKNYKARRLRDMGWMRIQKAIVGISFLIKFFIP